MPKQYRPFAVLARCWLHEELRLSPEVAAEPLESPLNFEREVDLVLALADRLGIKPAAGFRAAASDKLEGVEPTALLRFAPVDAADFGQAYAAIERDLELACSVLTYYTTNSVLPVAVILVESDDTFRARFLPTVEPAMIHVDGYAARTPTVFSAAASKPQLALALSLVRLGQQAARSEFRIFHYVQALEVLAAGTPGGSINVKLRRYLASLGIEVAASPADPRRDFADVLADIRNAVAHGKPLDAANVQPYSAPYLAEPELERRVRDFVRDVITRAADPTYRP